MQPKNSMAEPSISEDCLYLNVFTPTLQPPSPLPVLVFFYGGSFSLGSSGFPLYNAGRDVAMLQNVIVVTLNYRLSAFGFMASRQLAKEDKEGSTGNAGMQV